MPLRRLHILPCAVFLLVLLTFIITYIIAVLLDHVEPGFPYISDTGTIPPESCVFSQLVNVAAVLLLACVYIRYRQIGELEKDCIVKLPRFFNCVASFLGAVSCLGLDLVANFQEKNVLTVHMIGAFMCFIAGTFYFCLQTFISSRTPPEITPPWMFRLRCSLCVFCYVFTATTIAPGILSMRQFEGADVIKWQRDDGGWELHLASSISEWLLVVCFCSFILTYYREFQTVSIDLPFTREVRRSYVTGSVMAKTQQV